MFHSILCEAQLNVILNYLIAGRLIETCTIKMYNNNEDSGVGATPAELAHCAVKLPKWPYFKNIYIYIIGGNLS